MFGGEPTIYPGFGEVVGFLDADPGCVRCDVSTNGSVDSRVDALCRVAHPAKFVVSVSVHPLARRFDWERLKDRIARLHRAGLGVYPLGVSTAATADRLAALSADLELTAGLRINTFHNLRPEKYQ